MNRDVTEFPTLITGMPAWKYHQDPCETPSLSASMAKILLTQSPAHAYLAHPQLGAGKLERDHTASTEKGEIVHSMLTGDGELAVIDFDSFRTKAAKEAKEAAYQAHQIPILKHKHEGFEKSVGMIRGRMREFGIELNGEYEASIFWEETASNGDTVLCRCRMDHVDVTTGQIDDFKTCASAHPKAVQKHIEQYGYHIQATAYQRALASFLPELAGRTNFRFLFFETEAPYPLTPAVMAGTMKQLGELLWRQAVDLWAHCLREDHWPAYVEETLRVEASPWALREFDEGTSDDPEDA